MGASREREKAAELSKTNFFLRVGACGHVTLVSALRGAPGRVDTPTMTAATIILATINGSATAISTTYIKNMTPPATLSKLSVHASLRQIITLI